MSPLTHPRAGRPWNVSLATQPQRASVLPVLALALALTLAWAGPLPAASPPTITTIASGYGPIHGGVAAGPDGVVYFTAMTTNATEYAKIVALNPNDLVKWTWQAPATGTNYNMLAVPALDTAGQRLYVGNDRGDFRCLNTANGSVVWTYSVPSGTDKKIRSGAALDPERPGAPAVYFHCNNGYLYALNAQSGGVLWSNYTANVGAPLVADNPLPVSSSPVIASNGNVYVGTAKANNTGSLRAFNRTNGVSLWELQLGAPVEASPAIGANGWIYVGTRMVLSNQTFVGGDLHGINPATPAKVWSTRLTGIELNYPSTDPGLIASPVIDQAGFVYQGEFHDWLYKIRPESGGIEQKWNVFAKFCQPAAITQDGLLVLGTSADQYDVQEKRGIRAFDTQSPGQTPLWSVGQVQTTNVGDFLGSAAVRVNSPITYIADMNGRVYRFDAGSALMESPWPTFQCGNRRAGKFNTAGGYHLLELPGYYYSVYPPTPRAVNRYGVAVGQAYGYPAYPYGSGLGFNAAKWHNGVLNGAWGYYYVLGSYATGINTSGDAVGYVDDGFYRRPLYWPANVSNYPQYLPLPSGFTTQYSFASDIADDGTIIGYGRQSSTTNVIRWTKSGGSYVANNAGSPTGGNQAFAYAYSNAKRFAGKAVFNLTDGWRAYVTQTNALSFSGVSGLGTLGGSQSEAWDVHDDSGTVGWAHNSSGRRRAFRVPIGVTSVTGRELPRLEGTSSTTYNSEAYGINRYSSVVGTVQNDSGVYRAFFFTPGVHTQLANLSNIVLDSGQTPGDLGWVLTSAIAINDSGTMVGVGTKDGSTRAWLLEPRE